MGGALRTITSAAFTSSFLALLPMVQLTCAGSHETAVEPLGSVISITAAGAHALYICYENGDFTVGPLQHSQGDTMHAQMPHKTMHERAGSRPTADDTNGGSHCWSISPTRMPQQANYTC